MVSRLCALCDPILSVRPQFSVVSRSFRVAVPCDLVWESPGRRTETVARSAAKSPEPDAFDTAGGKTGPGTERLASKEDLIISKLWWAKESDSELQRRDVRNLAGTGCDTEYIERWTKQLELHSLWKECNP